MAANTVIHKIDTDTNEFIVSLYDDDILVYDYVNLGIDGTGNTIPGIERLNTQLRKYRERIKFQI